MRELRRDGCRIRRVDSIVQALIRESGGINELIRQWTAAYRSATPSVRLRMNETLFRILSVLESARTAEAIRESQRLGQGELTDDELLLAMTDEQLLERICVWLRRLESAGVLGLALKRMAEDHALGTQGRRPAAV